MTTSLADIRAICADFDGTIADTRLDFDLMRQRVRELAAQEGLDGDQLSERYVLELVAESEQRLGAGSPSAQRFRRRADRMMAQMELAAAQEGRLFAGVSQALAQLAERGVKIAVVTRNCRRAVRHFLRLHPFVCDVLVTRDDVSRVKPDPEHLWHALRLLGIPPHQAAMIGDHPTDVACGKAAGLTVVGVLTSGAGADGLTAAGADLVLPSLAELAAHLDG